MSKKLLLILVIFMLYQVFIYGTFTGFNVSGKELMHKINFAPFYPWGAHISKIDILTNVSFFFIFGMVFFHAFGQKRKFSILIFTIAAVSGMVLAGVVEFAELFMESRVTSVFDVILALFGTISGYLAGFLFYFCGIGLSGTKIRKVLTSRPLYFFTFLYALFLLVEAAFPFDLSLRVSDIWHHIKSLRLMPSGRLAVFELLFSHKMFIFAIFGFFLQRSLKSCRALLIGLAFALITEAIQLFVISGTPAIGDIVIKSSGLICGITAGAILKKDYQIYIGYAIMLLFYYLYPFQFSFAEVKAKLGPGILIPFRAQVAVTSINVFGDFMHTVLLFLPLGFSLGVKRVMSGYRNIGLLRLFLTGLSMGLGIEIMQLFIKGRVAEVTDALYGGIGCLLGGYLCKTQKTF